MISCEGYMDSIHAMYILPISIAKGTQTPYMSTVSTLIAKEPLSSTISIQSFGFDITC